MKAKFLCTRYRNFRSTLSTGPLPSGIRQRVWHFSMIIQLMEEMLQRKLQWSITIKDVLLFEKLLLYLSFLNLNPRDI